MGYYTYLTGELAITPAIPAALRIHFDPDAIDPPWAGKNWNDWTSTYDTDDATALVFDESVKCYDIEADLANLQAWLRARGHDITGQIWGDGEESDDQWTVRLDEDGTWFAPATITFDDYRRIDPAPAPETAP